MKANGESRPQHSETIDASASKSELIALLNDRFRRDGRGGTVAITRGLLAMGSVAAVMALVRTYDSFDAYNDPYGERDFGSLDCGDVTLIWKIDDYDKAMQFGSPNPADPDLTTRMLTVMLADECEVSCLTYLRLATEKPFQDGDHCCRTHFTKASSMAFAGSTPSSTRLGSQLR